MSDEIEEFKDWVSKLKQISIEGTIFLFLGLIFILIGVLNPNSNFSSPLVTAGGFIFLGGVLFISLGKLNKS